MELFILITLFCLGLAAHPFASRRLPPLVHGTLGGLCVIVSFSLLALVANGQTWAQEKPAVELEVETPAAPVAAERDEHADALPAVNSDPHAADSHETSLTPEADTVIIPPGRPHWVEALPVREGKVHYTSVCSEPYATTAQAQHALDKQLQSAVAEYIKEELQSEWAPQVIRFSTAEIKQKFVPSADVYHEKIGVSFGSMHQVHARLQFDENFNRELHRRWDKISATFRLAETGVVSGGVLLLIATVFGYFRLDNATRGYYTSRLQFMAAAAILAVVAVSAILFQEMDSLFIRWF